MCGRGIQIVPATGRTVRGIPDRIRTLPGVRYAMTTNGAVVADLKEDRIISTCRIPVDTALRVLEMARDSGDDIMYDAYMDGIGCTTQYFMITQNGMQFLPEWRRSYGRPAGWFQIISGM